MPTLDWLNRADAFTTSARVPYRLLETVRPPRPCWCTAKPAAWDHSAWRRRG